MKKIIPAGKLPFSKGILHDLKYQMEISGQIGLDSNGKLKEGIENQTNQSLENVKKILGEVGWDFSNLVKVRIFLKNIKDYEKVNEIYSNHFSSDFPTRVALAIAELPLGALIEIDCTAAGSKIN